MYKEDSVVSGQAILRPANVDRTMTAVPAEEPGVSAITLKQRRARPLAHAPLAPPVRFSSRTEQQSDRNAEHAGRRLR
jgi:hypothetical protein